MKSKRIIFIVGPTASGKSKISYELAKRFDAAIVNSDSLQVYQKLDIGTAKPSHDERNQCSHYLFDCVEPGDDFTAGKYRKKALEIINNTEHKTYIFVGGSGFYIKALVEGMFEEVPLKKEAQEKVQELKEQLTKTEFFNELVRLDPDYCKKIHPNDIYRVSRALELNLSLGKTMRQISDEFETKKEKLPFPYIYIGIDIDREILQARVKKRLSMMLDNGFRDEVEAILGLGLQGWKPLGSVGYKEMISLISGQIEDQEMQDEIIKNTMRLAKRQMTWFRANKDIHWFSNEDLDSMLDLCGQFLFDN